MLEPYSRAVVSGSQVFCSATLGIDPATGKAPESAVAQAEQALMNLGLRRSADIPRLCNSKLFFR
jgi:enamine deaminase RidA (YjgF/YER057c/UK114 family)